MDKAAASLVSGALESLVSLDVAQIQHKHVALEFRLTGLHDSSLDDGILQLLDAKFLTHFGPALLAGNLILFCLNFGLFSRLDGILSPFQFSRDALTVLCANPGDHTADSRVHQASRHIFGSKAIDAVT